MVVLRRLKPPDGSHDGYGEAMNGGKKRLGTGTADSSAEPSGSSSGSS